ncbi:MAG: DUF3159 domain-containing protein [Actinobacteria bacterium]|nr:DUF3159 domain-containing protein [Actinomycetota bacterium]NBY83060.1 DUF3159 domain-containing protein [Actinomycetota bacterium]NCU78124.1 DUF3159 domain-containing protein [Actinomycetota bacterium]NCU96297.1 DUF3159 domain-containing protein [Actinomycetota bacterium]NCZ76610.1 DUF3159 domain-containing protein [Actinomycetota bacterium]
MSYQGHNEDKDKILSALGGKRGLIDSGLPALIFLAVFNLTSRDVNAAIYAAVSISIVLTAIRLIRRETIQHAFSGLIGVAICAVFSKRSGNAADFYLPGLYINVGYALLYLFTNLIRWPILGIMLGPILGENFLWRKDPARLKAYITAGWLWVGMFLLRVLVQYPLYKSGSVNALGSARLIMGYPLFILTAWATWQVLRKTPTTKAN